MAKEVIFSVTNDVVTDQRVLKIASVVAASGANVTIIGRELPWSLEADQSNFRITRYRMLFRKGFLFYKFFNLRLFFTLLMSKADLLVANDLDTLLPNFLVSKLRGIPLVYDSHEYFTGSPELKERPIVRGVWKTIERLTVPRVKYMMTVNRSIAGLYESEYGIKATVVRNFSRDWHGEVSARVELGISSDDLLCVIQGTGLNQGRGGIELVEAISGMENVHLLVTGRGSQVAAMRERVLELGLIDSVTFLPVMPWDDMMSYTSMGDIGLSLDRRGSLNYENSLPNKIFDYMNAGLAIISTDLKEVSRVIEEAGCGIVINDPEPTKIVEALLKFRDNRDFLEKCRDNSKKAFPGYRWENETGKVRELYSRAGLTFKNSEL